MALPLLKNAKSQDLSSSPQTLNEAIFLEISGTEGYYMGKVVVP